MAEEIPVNLESLFDATGSYVVLTVEGKKLHVVPVDTDEGTATLIYRRYDPHHPDVLNDDEEILISKISVAHKGEFPKPALESL